VLNGLAEQVAVSNQTLAAAEARYRQSAAAVTAARAGLFPNVGASAGASRSRRGEGATSSSYDIGLDARWEIDLWGRVRRLVEASRAGEEASAADLENARLSLQAQLVTAYFQLRVADAGADLLDDTVEAVDRSFKIAQNRYDAGVAAKVDVVQAEGQLRSVQAQVIDLRATRAQLEHAVAVLIGKPPAAFTLTPTKFEMKGLPDIPPGCPLPCSSAGPTSPRASGAWPRPMRASAWHRRRIFPSSRSPGAPASRAARSRRSSPPLPGCGRWARGSA
jgi:outer membrane protein TolC